MNKLLATVLILLCLATTAFAQATDPVNEFKELGFSQKTLFRVVNDLIEAQNNRCFTDVGGAVGSPTSKLAIAATATYSIDGVFYAVNATDAISFSSGHTAQPVLTQCYYLVQVDSAGAFSTVQGPILSTSSPETLQLPRPTAGKCPLFLVKVSLASTATFTPGTTGLDASNVTDTYYDLSVRPITLKY